MSVISFLVNLVSLYLFHGIKKHDHSHSHKDAHKHSHKNPCSHSHREPCHSHQNLKSKKNSSSITNKSFSGSYFIYDYFFLN